MITILKLIFRFLNPLKYSLVEVLLENNVSVIFSGETKKVEDISKMLLISHIEHLKQEIPPHSLDLTKPSK